jgi:hypothetical protein
MIVVFSRWEVAEGCHPLSAIQLEDLSAHQSELIKFADIVAVVECSKYRVLVNRTGVDLRTGSALLSRVSWQWLVEDFFSRAEWRPNNNHDV